MKISIIIPSKDRSTLLNQTLERAYKAVEHLNAEIIVVNDSKTAAIRLNSQWEGKIRVVDSPKSGVASARNFGASQARADLLLFMDDDMWVDEENIRTTLSLHQEHPANCCINLNWVYPRELDQRMRKTQFGRYLSRYGFNSLKGWYKGLRWEDHDLFPVNHITSQYLSIRKTDFLRTGGYNETFPHAGFEDYDFAKRLLQLSIQPYVYPLSMVYHHETDRSEVEPWLARKRRGGETRRVAVEVGYTELAIENGLLKNALYRMLVLVQPALQRTLKVIPNSRYLDPVYFRLLNILLGTAFFEGYHKKNKELHAT